MQALFKDVTLEQLKGLANAERTIRNFSKEYPPLTENWIPSIMRFLQARLVWFPNSESLDMFQLLTFYSSGGCACMGAKFPDDPYCACQTEQFISLNKFFLAHYFKEHNIDVKDIREYVYSLG